MEQKEYVELRDEIQRLRDEQQRLRDEQERLRQSSDGHQEHGDQQEPADKTAAPDQKEDQKEEKKEDQEQEARKPPLKERVIYFVRTHRKGVLLGTVGFVAAVAALVFLLLYLSSYESTDDAQVDAHLHSITSRISGMVAGVYVENNQQVGIGQLLVDLDPRDYQTRLDQARGSYAQALEQLRAEHPNVPITETTNITQILTTQADVATGEAALAAANQDHEARLATLRQAQANNAKAQTDVTRYQYLVEKGEVSREQFDTIVTSAKADAAAVDAADASAKAAAKSVDQARAQLGQAQSRLEQAQSNAPRSVAIRQADVKGREASLIAARAQAEQAQLDLSYCKIFAPVGGVVSERSAEIGQQLQPGEQTMVISQIDYVWITANFKETQLKKIRPGQPVDVHVDTFNTTYRGYVESMPGATGAVLSLLPPQNATGNFVKVVQRLPVRIRLNDGQDPEHRLRPGMSVEPKVWLK